MSRTVRICVADDDAELREYFTKILPYLGYEVLSVSANGAELVTRCRDQEPDLVITDVRMPVLDGIRAAKEITRFNSIPVILMTGDVVTPLLDHCLTDKTVAVLVKPITQCDLERTIVSVMQRSKSAASEDSAVNSHGHDRSDNTAQLDNAVQQFPSL